MGNIINSSKQQLLNKISYYIKKDGSIFFNQKINTCKSKLIIIENNFRHVIPIWYKQDGIYYLINILDCKIKRPLEYSTYNNIITIKL